MDGQRHIAFHASRFAYGFPALQVETLDLPPLQAPSYAAALLAGELVAAAALHGLLLARRDGRGAHLDVSLQEAIAALDQSQFNAPERTAEVRRQATASASNPTAALLAASDGWVAISPREEHQWARWLAVMGDPAWGQDPRFTTRTSRAEHWPALHALLAEWSAKRAHLEIFEAAQAARVACRRPAARRRADAVARSPTSGKVTSRASPPAQTRSRRRFRRSPRDH